jgi:aminoglycoside N3'-acetyltransferase
LLPIKILKEKLNLIKNKNLVFHSDLTILGRELSLMKGHLIRYISQELNTNNLAIPAFNLKTNAKDDIDMSSVDLSMGSLPVESVDACNNKKGYRTPNPIHSYCFFPDTNNIKLINNNKSFGNDSVFDFFIKNDFIWVSFGAPINSGFTILHHLETIAKVPYRKKIEFNRNILIEGKVKKICFEYYARKNNSFLQNFHPAIKYLTNINILNEINMNGKSIYFGSSKNISEAILNKLTNDPYFLTKKNLFKK